MPSPVAGGVPVAIVTGAARRIGRTLALDLARCGWDLGLHYGRSRNEAERLAAEVASMGRRVVLLPADLAEASDVASLVPRCAEAIGPVTCLVNNASLFVEDGLATLDPQLWDRHMAVNLRAPVFLAQSFARYLPPHMSGNIINIIDQRVWRPTPMFFSYSASKAGLWAVTQTLAQALAPRIRVNGIGPGPVLRSIHQTDEQFARQASATLLGRAIRPEEIAKAVRFILDAPSMTGQMIALDAGQHLAWETPDVIDVEGH
jgi:NAD(P)-dependent dehydrogenase (short-subunit alcohol dehydrogenase family)